MTKQDRHIGNYRLPVSNLKATKFFTRNPVAKAIANKLIYDNVNKQLNGRDGIIVPPNDILKRLSDKTTSNIEDSANIFQTLPDLKLAMEIWTSYIISPKDFMTESLLWKIDDYGDYNAEMFNEMLDVLRDYFETKYELSTLLKPAIEDALFKTGSYILAVIPESNIDDVINGKSDVSNESYLQQYLKKDKNTNQYFFESKGFLGSPTAKKQQIGLEAYIANENFTVLGNDPNHANQIYPGLIITDNPDAIKLSKALSKIKKTRVKKRMRSIYGLESFELEPILGGRNPNDKQDEINLTNDGNKHRVINQKVKDKIAQGLYSDRAYDGKEIVMLKDQRHTTRHAIGHPLVMKVPSNAVIPVHVPGNPRDRLGAFILLDEYGNPLDNSEFTDYYNEDRQRQRENNRSGASDVLKTMANYQKTCAGMGLDINSDKTSFNDLATAYSSILESQLITSLSNGIYGDQVTISHNEEIMRVMFNRAIKKMRTQLFYCPNELLTYFAFDYNKYGIGKSLLEDMKMILALRSGLLYSEIYSNIQNSIGRKQLTIELAEDEITPEKTIETALSGYAEANSWNPILNDSSPMQIINELRMNSVDVVIAGNNQVIPETNVSVEDKRLERPSPDTEFSDKIKSLVAGGLGIPASAMDESQQAQFAVQAINANVLFNKRAYMYQKITNRDFLYDHVSKYTMNSGKLITDLSLVIKDYADKLTDEQKAHGTTWPIIEDFIENLSVELPAPDALRIEDQQKDFDAMNNFLGAIIDATYPDEVLEGILPEEISDKSGAIRSIMKSLFIRKHIDANGYLPEFFDVLESDKDGVDRVSADVHDYLAPFAQAAVKIFFGLDKTRKEADDRRLKDVVPEDGMDGESSYSGSSDSSSDDSGDDSGSDDFGGDEEGGDEGGDEFDF